MPQAAILLFLYHARSSLGWQYAALFALAGGRFLTWAYGRWRRAERPDRSAAVGAAFVAGLLAASLFGLARFKQATYNAAYLGDQGPRTFWHNALMGYSYHPGLRDTLPIAVGDREAARLVLARLRAAGDPRLDATWDVEYMMLSLGGHCRFDWLAYEQAARETYFAVWKDSPARAAGCYAYYKPRDVARLLKDFALVTGAATHSGRARGLLLGAVACLVGLGALLVAGHRDGQLRRQLRRSFAVGCVAIAFSLIPAMAFYAGITTLSCFFTLFASAVLTGVVWVGAACRGGFTPLRRLRGLLLRQVAPAPIRR